MKTMLAALISAALFAGCAGMRGGDSPGYGAGPQRTVGEVVDDATILTQVKAALAADPDLSALKINVDANQGVVRLKGEVKSLALRRKADSVASGIKGVKSVDNQLVVTG